MESHLRSLVEKSIPLDEMNDVVFEIIARSNPRLACHIQNMTEYTTPYLTTLFVRTSAKFKVSESYLDYFLAFHPATVFYATALVPIFLADEILALSDDMTTCEIIFGAWNHYDFEKGQTELLQATTRLMKKVPLSSLKSIKKLKGTVYGRDIDYRTFAFEPLIPASMWMITCILLVSFIRIFMPRSRRQNSQLD